MAFPVTSLLTSFSGGDESPLSESGVWSGPIRPGDNRYQRLSEQCAPITAGANSAYRGSYTEVESWLTIAVIPTVGSSRWCGVAARIASAGGSGYDLYLMQYDHSNSRIDIIRIIDGGETSLDNATSVTLSDGDKIGISVSGTGATVTVKGYTDTGSGWTEVLSADDVSGSRLTAAGPIGLLSSNHDNWRFDDFGGGEATGIQTAYPTADSVDGSWTDQDGNTTALYDAINETSAATADYIRSELAPQDSGCRVKLGSLTDPGSSTGHIIHWQVGKDTTGGATINMIVKLYQGGGDNLGGGTLIADFSRNNVDAFTTYDETLSAGEADTITNYADLYLEFWADTA